MQYSITHEALARIFDIQTLKELVLTLLYFEDDEVSSACLPGMYVHMQLYVCMYGCEVWTLKDQFA